MAKKILVLGGGAGGVVVSNLLAKELEPGEAEITLIDRNPYHEFPPSYLWVMSGIRKPEDIRRPLKNLERKGIKFVQDEIIEILPAENKVKGKNREYTYDILVVGLGSEADFSALPGSEHICAPWTLESTLKCREMLKDFKGGKVVVGVAGKRYKCPPAPFEVAFLTRYLLDQRGFKDKADITVAHFWKEPMEPFGPVMVKGFKMFLNQYNIKYKPNFMVARVEKDKLISTEGEELPYDLAFVIPPHKAAKPVRESELSDPETGFMKVKKTTLRHPKYENVFGIGDVIAPELNLGMAGVFAHFQGEYIAAQILDEVKGGYEGELYNMGGVCTMDMGYVGAAVYCDFSKKISGEAEYPDCVMLGGMRLFRLTKFIWEKYWLEKYF